MSVPAGTEIEPIDLAAYADGARAAWFSVESADRASLAFQVRVFDESRTALNWGTFVPAVDWNSAKRLRFSFVRVPTATPFRHTVRVYSFSPRAGHGHVRYYDADSGATLAIREFTITTDRGEAQIDSLGIPELADATEVRIEVESDADPIWSLVSITNDETQVVTILPGTY
ncbi:MAG: hypothetical protein WBX15_20085 [Thermoanaerobaculia bacterium]